MTYTHADHWKRGIHAAKTRQTVSNQLVQVKKGQLNYCAQIVEAYSVPGGPDCWVVVSHLPENARFTVTCNNVWLCGDDLCLCRPVGDTGQAGACDGQAGGTKTGQEGEKCK